MTPVKLNSETKFRDVVGFYRVLMSKISSHLP